MKLPKFFKPRQYERLEVYMLAADNPVGRKQLRPFFKRRRSKELLTREQVTAIKLGRKLLRQEMKAQGLKSREDFEVTATNLNLYFDRKGLLWPLILWFGKGNTLAKVLASTVLLTTAVTVSVPVVKYLEKIITETITQEIEKEIEKDRFVIDLSENLFEAGFVLGESIPDLEENPSSNLICPPAVGIPCISIKDIPENVDTIKDGAHHDVYFAYTFYCKYYNQKAEDALQADPNADISKYDIEYEWQMNLDEESKNLSEAVWVMIFEDGKMIFYAEPSATGSAEALPPFGDDTRGYFSFSKATVDASTEAYEGFAGLMQLAKNRDEQFQEILTQDAYAYYRVIPETFLTPDIVAEGRQDVVRHNDIHKYTVVIWLEGDDPECTDDKIGGHIGMDFHMRLKGEAGGADVGVESGDETTEATLAP